MVFIGFQLVSMAFQALRATAVVAQALVAAEVPGPLLEDAGVLQPALLAEGHGRRHGAPANKKPYRAPALQMAS